MKTAPIVPATLAYTPEGVPQAPAFGDVYHATAGALAQARHVFLGGSALPGRWAGRDRFVVLETGFGLGNNFLATWDAWRHDAQRCERLVFVSIERHPPSRADLRAVHAASALPELAEQLVAAWPPLTPNLHTLTFEGGRVRLLLGLGDIAALLPELMAPVDAFYLDGFAPDRNPAMWTPEVLKQLGRLATPGATAATWSTARAVRDGLVTAGFAVERRPGFAGKHGMTVAQHAPRHRPPPLPGGLPPAGPPREALIVGAGLAGCAAAWALAREGWRPTVLDRGAGVAAGSSGNPAGLFHGAVLVDDGPHARLHRAAALRTAQLLAPWIVGGRVRGQCAGLLRLAPEAPLRALGLPDDYAAWLDAPAAAARCGLPVPSGGWWFPQGGWVVPGDVARALLDESGARLAAGRAVARIARDGDGWQALDDDGQVLARAPVLVLANAHEAPALLAPDDAAALGRLDVARGQLTGLPWHDGLPAPRVPVAGRGYALPPIDGRLWCGATTQLGDLGADVRDADHQHNLAQLARLCGGEVATPAALAARVGWRAVTPDRLPLVGALPDLAAFADAPRADRVRLVPRQRDAGGGLYVLSGLGSRGITWAALCAEVLASWITGAPCPVEADLRDAIDPARALVARRRRG